MFFKDFIKNPQTTIALTFMTHIISGIDGVVVHSNATTLITPFESVRRWPRQNTFIISLVSDHNMLLDGRFIKKKVPNIRPFEKY